MAKDRKEFPEDETQIDPPAATKGGDLPPDAHVGHTESLPAPSAEETMTIPKAEFKALVDRITAMETRGAQIAAVPRPSDPSMRRHNAEEIAAFISQKPCEMKFWSFNPMQRYLIHPNETRTDRDGIKHKIPSLWLTFIQSNTPGCEFQNPKYPANRHTKPPRPGCADVWSDKLIAITDEDIVKYNLPDQPTRRGFVASGDSEAFYTVEKVVRMIRNLDEFGDTQHANRVADPDVSYAAGEGSHFYSDRYWRNLVGAKYQTRAQAQKVQADLDDRLRHMTPGIEKTGAVLGV